MNTHHDVLTSCVGQAHTNIYMIPRFDPGWGSYPCSRDYMGDALTILPAVPARDSWLILYVPIGTWDVGNAQAPRKTDVWGSTT